MVVNGKTTLLFVFNTLKGIRSVHFSSPIYRSQRFTFRIRPDGTWQQLGPTKIHSIDDLQPTGDFDGDELIDTVMRWSEYLERKFRQWLVARWGNGAPATLLPVKHIDLTNLYATDVDRDGCCEIVPLSSSQRQLTVWQFRLTERRFVTLAQLTLSLPTQLSRPSQSSVGSAIVKPSQPPTVLEPNLYVADIDGDGLKDFIVVWTKFLYPVGSLAMRNLPPPECVAVQVVWWRGKNLRSRSFLHHEVTFPKLPTNLWTLNEHRLAIVEAIYEKRRLTFRPLSLSPLWVQF